MPGLLGTAPAIPASPSPPTRPHPLPTHPHPTHPTHTPPHPLAPRPLASPARRCAQRASPPAPAAAEHPAPLCGAQTPEPFALQAGWAGAGAGLTRPGESRWPAGQPRCASSSGQPHSLCRAGQGTLWPPVALPWGPPASSSARTCSAAAATLAGPVCRYSSPARRRADSAAVWASIRPPVGGVGAPGSRGWSMGKSGQRSPCSLVGGFRRWRPGSSGRRMGVGGWGC